MRIILTWLCAILTLCSSAEAKETRHTVYGRMAPYSGSHVPGVDTSTLTGKVMCGYQGWFSAPGDGSGRGWVHYGKGKQFNPQACTIDLWPDMSELSDAEKVPTDFKNKNGKQAYVFSSYNRDTVVRHFKWMKDYSIDGVFLQRFGSTLRSPQGLNHRNVVTTHVQAGANQYGRTWAMMYDLSGLKSGEIKSIVMQDWKHLVKKMKITKDKSYLHHNGRPVVAIWGVGFKDREYSLDECGELIRFIRNNPEFGGHTVMLGVPTYWHDLKRDCVDDKKLHDIIKQADIISPWTVGRYNSPAGSKTHVTEVVTADITWAHNHNKDYLPVAFPGFSWHNLKQSKGETAGLGQIPRLKGQFLWSQALNYKQAGAQMLYVAMFDEIDEGTAIFKCTNQPPTEKNRFLTYKGLPSDHYLWLTGKIGRIMSGKYTSNDIPTR